jgi:rhodanese-related sulfurtransferase
MAMKKGFRALVDEAEALVETIPATDATALVDDGNVVLVDLRDIRERQREGFIPGSVHAPRGMLEFWVDPESPYHRDLFAGPERFVFYCQSGWRSALAARTVIEMGMERVAHVGGGFSAWKEADGAVLKTDDGREPR